MNKSTYKSHVGKVFHLGRYTCTVEDVIAEGGFAIVFRVRAQTGEVFALKRMYVNNEQDLKVCKREIQIVSSLTHKNIIRYVDSSITLLSDGVYEVFLLLEYCRRTVMQLLLERQNANTGLTEQEVMRIFCDVVEAVARLHHCTTPVIHRDLKVENILIDDRSSYVLCDFGSATAKVLEPARIGAARCEEELARYTTLAYRAPEMIDVYTGRPITTKADIWALGCLLFYLTFFQLPFGDSTLAIQSGRFSFPANSARSYSSGLLALIRYCLQIDPDRRPDIYQVAACAFAVASRTNPVVNLHRSAALSLDQLIALHLDPGASAQPAATKTSASAATTPKKAVDKPDTRTATRATDLRATSSTTETQASGANGSQSAARPRPHAAGTTSANGNPLLVLPPPNPNNASALSHSGSAQSFKSNGGSTSALNANPNVNVNVPAQNSIGIVATQPQPVAFESGSQQLAQTQVTEPQSNHNVTVTTHSQSATSSTSASANCVEIAREQLSGLTFTGDTEFVAEFEKLRSQTQTQAQSQPHVRTASQPGGSAQSIATQSHSQQVGHAHRHASGGALPGQTARPPRPGGMSAANQSQAQTGVSRSSSHAAASGGQVFEYKL